MELLLQRGNSSAKSTIGELYINKKFICFSLEDVVRPAGVKIFGETAIPSGKYQVVVTYSERFQQLMPLLVDVPGFSGCRVHFGNTDVQTHGCVLVGTAKETDFITESRKAYAIVYKLISDACKTGKVWLTIKNAA